MNEPTGNSKRDASDAIATTVGVEKEMEKDNKVYVFKNFDWMTRQEEEAFRKEAQERGQTVLNVFTLPRPPLYDSTGSVQGYYDENGTIRPYTYE